MTITGGYWVIDGTKIRDLGYRNNSYVLDVGGRLYKFPTDSEAYEFIDNFKKDSGK